MGVDRYHESQDRLMRMGQAYPALEEEYKRLLAKLNAPLVVVVDPSVINLSDLAGLSGPLDGLPIVRLRMAAYKTGSPLQVLTRHGLQVLDPETLEPSDVEKALEGEE